MRQTWLVAILTAISTFASGQSDAHWQAGVGTANITPTEPLWMAGYASRKAPADGKTTDLWAKALILQDADGNRGIAISLDLVGINRSVSQEICQRLETKFGFERHQIAIFTSHTHSGPVVRRNLGPLHFMVLNEEQQKRILAYGDYLLDQLESAVKSASDDLAAAKVQWGSGFSSFAVNRRENKPETKVPEWRANGTLKGPVDHDVPVLSVRGEDDKLRAVLFGYACHATTVSFNQWNGDWPGYAQTEIEKTNPGCVALFWAGCGADQNPIPRRTVELAEKYGAQLAEAVNEVLKAPMPTLEPKLSAQYHEVELKLQQLPDPKALNSAEQSQNRFEIARAKHLRQQMEQKGAIADSYPFPIGVWKLGDQVDFVHLGGEVVIDYALRLKTELRGEQTWVAGYANDVMAYIPSVRVLREGGYEGGGSNVYYGIPGLWAESIEETIVSRVSELAKP